MSEWKELIKCKIVSSLEKVLPMVEPKLEESYGSMLLNERYNFQIAYYCSVTPRGKHGSRLVMRGGLAEYMTVRIEELAPSSVVNNPADDYYVMNEVGLLPDPLVPVREVGIPMPYGQWRALWVSVSLPETVKAGVYETELELFSLEGESMAKLRYTVEVIGAKLPKTDLKLTNWMHYDCIAQTHGVRLFSEEFYAVFANYLKDYTECGFNMLLTPLFTPPLDTAIGAERMTAQLVKVIQKGEEYEFDFTELKKFLAFALANGIEYVEFSHLFTQWGGKFCPKIVAEVDGEEKRVFGWDTDATDARYQAFLNAFFYALGKVVDEMGIRERCYFHLSDEPSEVMIPNYAKCREMVKKYIGDMPIMDALSHYEFYEQGLVDIPVTGLKAYEKFAVHNLENLFVYNCCGPTDEYYSNRFLNFPSQRVRVLGFQMYKTAVQGYLHWGFNFYNSVLSKIRVNPYSSTDCYGAFPSGDGFLVYPSDTGVYKSVRAEATNEGFQDYRALKLLESYIGRERVVKLLDEWGLDGYTVYPRDAVAHKAFREKINALIKEQV
ncbi:MAG: DUF4091 domain-containing protein [Clostridia bacterium]|nr:DUF4091 domain-containing protein [Clostridia bacterium]